ncbi:MAG: O-antigen polymerase [Candidatus Latescibacteria bacterium]|nr:O-antigen polymerase [Candidatus Latescibacterota bacterium]
MSAGDAFWLAFFLLIAAASIAFSMHVYGQWLTPASMYLGMNSLSMAFYHLRLVPLNDVSLTTHLLLLSSMALFQIGALLAIGGRSPDLRPAYARIRDARHLDTFFNVTAVLATFGWMLSATILVGRYGLVGLLQNIWVLQLEFQMQFIGYLNMIGIVVLPTYAIKHGLGRARPRDAFLAGLTVVGLLLAGIKTYIMVSVIGALLAWGICRPGRFRPQNLVLGVLILLGFFLVYNRHIDVFEPEAVDEAHAGSSLSILDRPYIYFVGSWPATESLVAGEMNSLPKPGSITFDALWKILGDGLHLVEPLPLALPFTNIGITEFNVYAFVGEMYWDWDWTGALFASLVYGFVSARLHLRALTAPYWGNVLVYALFGYGIFLSPFMYYYRFNLIVQLLYVYAIGFVLLRGGVLVDRRRHV